MSDPPSAARFGMKPPDRDTTRHLERGIMIYDLGVWEHEARIGGDDAD